MAYPSFNSGDVLNASDMNAVGLWLIKTQTIGTAVSSVTVNDVFSASYDDYFVSVSGVTFSVGDVTFYARPGGIATANYYGGGFYQTYGSTTLTGQITQAASEGIPVGLTTTNQKTVIMFDITSPFIADWTRGMGRLIAGNNYMAHYGGILATTASYTSLVVRPSSGTMTGGTIRVYGYRN